MDEGIYTRMTCNTALLYIEWLVVLHGYSDVLFSRNISLSTI